MFENSSPIVKCSHCRQIIGQDEFNAHICDVQVIGQKEIQVIEFMDVSCNGKKLMMGQGIDGVLYTFEVVPRKAIPIMKPLSDDGYHEPQNGREVNGTV